MLYPHDDGGLRFTETALRFCGGHPFYSDGNGIARHFIFRIRTAADHIRHGDDFRGDGQSILLQYLKRSHFA